MSSYKQFAYYYDHLMNHAPYDEWVKFTENAMERYGIDGKSIVELGCGTGEISVRLAKLGYEVTGIDLSHDMLTIADQKAREGQVTIPFIQQDIRQLSGFSEVDLFISYCDVINYIPEKSDLERTFNHIYKALKSGGYFIFDIHNIYYAENHLIGETFADVTEELAYVWKCYPGENIGEMYHDMHFFVHENNDQYTHFTEEHYQRTYPVSTYKKLLEACHFQQIECFADFKLKNTFNEKNSERIFIIAQK